MERTVNMVNNFGNFWFADDKAGRGGYVPLISNVGRKR